MAPRLLRTSARRALLRAGLLIEVGPARDPGGHPVAAGWPAAMIVVFGIHTVVWGVVVTTIRQRTCPSAMFGRVTSVYALLDLGGAALGSLLGGLVAQAYGIVADLLDAGRGAMAVVAVASPGGRLSSRHRRRSVRRLRGCRRLIRPAGFVVRSPVPGLGRPVGRPFAATARARVA